MIDLDRGLIIDNFAGGGGASTGIEHALGRSPDVAINHDAEAVALHAANHPDTLHLCQNVWKADPQDVVRQASARRCAILGIPFRILPVAFAWFSPDCKHFSKAKGSKPVEKGIRDLAWVVVHWAKRVRPRIIALENVEEFKDWGPLIETADGKLVPCPVRKSLTFKRWVRELKRLGYRVDHRELRACDYGAPTIRKRLFVVARLDGEPIVWAQPSHAKPSADGTVPRGLLPWRTAAECIDWSLDCPSIFDRPRPLAENTLRRVARGVIRYVVNAERPFIVGVGGRMGQSPERPVDWPAQTLTAKADSALVMPLTHQGGDRGHPTDEPFKTVTAAHRGEMAVVQPLTVSTAHGGTTGRAPYVWPADEPLRTMKASPEYSVVEPFVARIGQTGGGGKYVNGSDEPLTTITSKAEHLVVQPFVSRVDQTSAADRNGIAPIDDPLRTIHTTNPFAVIAPHVTKFRANSDGHRIDEPMHTVTANSFKKRPGGAAPLGLVSASLATYYGPKEGEKGRGAPVDEPLRTQTTENRHAVVAAFMAQHNSGNDGHDAREPVSTIVGKGCTQGVVEAKAAILSHTYTSNTVGGNGDPEQPAKTITAGGTHHAVVECDLSAEDMAGAERVAAFIAKYYGQGVGQACDEPLHVVTTKDRFCLVTVNGWPIVDIGLRMLQPVELYRAQGFPADYVIDGPGPNGKPLTKTAQVRMCGNSVCPPIAQAIARALVFGSTAEPMEGVAD
ncbi:DNA cytosine methyltransferase [Nitrobacter sp.]|uniref:DNA cytosine methyltransferase n=1 Tax=Nitrobacter sp. TaxID=29420 RepID=UPI0029CABF70|nr:DNA cytosine methyltransferase [Nitrobacter sp.]